MQCHECGETISDRAADCPHCGASVGSVDDPGGAGERDGTDVPRDGPADPVGPDDSRGPDVTGSGEPPEGQPGEPPERQPTERVDPSSNEPPERQPTERVDGSAADPPERQPTERVDGSAADPSERQPTEPVDSQSAEPPERQPTRPVDDDEDWAFEEQPDNGPAGQPAEQPDGQPASPAEGESPPPADDGSAPPPDGQQSPPPEGQPAEAGTGYGGQGAGGQAGSAGVAGAAGQATPGGSSGGQGQPAPAGQQPAGQQVEGPPADHPPEDGGFDAKEFVGRLPLFPGAAAGFATGIILVTISVAYAAMIPDTRLATHELGALVFLDLQFAASGHVTPALFGVFDIVSPPPAAVGFLYLLPPFFLYTASKIVVAVNSDEETTIPETFIGGMAILPGYLPIVILVHVLAGSVGFVGPTLLGTFNAAVVFPLFFGVIGGLAGGILRGSERRVGTFYTLGAMFAIAIGCFIATFIAAIPAPSSPEILTHVFLGVFSYVAANVFAFGGGQVLGAAGVLALFVVGLTVVAAAFVRAWRSDDDSALRGIAKGFTMAPSYLLFLGFFAALVPWLADSYIQDTIGMEFLAAGYADFIVRMRLTGILEYVIFVVFAAVLFTVLLSGVTSGVATLLRREISGD